MRIAVLITCYNRYKSTLKCLDSLFRAVEQVGNDIKFEVYLVDDGSPDNTIDYVRGAYSNVNTWKGDGSLFWSGGTRKAWEMALNSQKAYSHYLWLNDDTYVFEEGLKELLCNYRAFSDKYGEVLLVGACQSSSSKTFSYGLRQGGKPVLPYGGSDVVFGNMVNGNVVLVSERIREKVGILDQRFTHGIGDSDYGLMAIKQGFPCVTTSVYVAFCDVHEVGPAWSNPSVTIRKRLENFFSVKGLNFVEYLYFLQKHWPVFWPVKAVRAVVKLLLPRLTGYLRRMST